MAPRKDASLPAPSASQTQQDASSEGIEDFELPKLLVTQLAKSALPQDVKLEDDTITALIKGSTVFINYLTSTAQDIAASRAHKTISGADVLKALEILEFGDFVSTFQGELEVFRQGTKAEKGKNKAITAAETKGKGKEKDKPSPSSFVQPATPQPAADVSHVVQEPREMEVDGPNINGNPTPHFDVEMRDATVSEPPHTMAKSVILPIE